MLVLSKHRLGSVEMNTWEYHSLPVDVLVDYNGHICLCRCGLTLHRSRFIVGVVDYDWVRLRSFHSLIVKYNVRHSSQHLDFLIDARLA